ncbi:MAG: RDD family protein [Actinomycetes bacterium]|nr:RDD family protein [Actinomycetes bacterium]
MSDSIVTGEAVLLESRPASVMTRALATLIDVTFHALVILLLGIGVFGQLVQLNQAQLNTVLIAGLATVAVILPTTVETLTRGRSLGKVITGTRVVRDDGGPTHLRHSLTRWSTAMIEVFLTAGMLAFTVAMVSSRSKRLGDMLAGTYVARVRGVEERDLPLLMPPELADWARNADMAALPDRTSLYARKFLARTATLSPQARQRLGLSLAAEVEKHVAPAPPPGTHPERFLAAVLVARRDREYLSALRQREATAGEDAVLAQLPHGIPDARP